MRDLLFTIHTKYWGIPRVLRGKLLQELYGAARELEYHQLKEE